MNRTTNLILAILVGMLIFIPVIFIGAIIRLTSKGSATHWSSRVGKGNKVFKMPKFRTMKLGAPDVATHLLNNPDEFVTPIGKLLRKTSLDEIPQLWSVIKGDMAFVGPRPALYNQDDLIALRTKKGIHKLTPGITGWAQIKGRDKLEISEKVEMDFYYLNNRSVLLDLTILINTICTAVKFDGISH